MTCNLVAFPLSNPHNHRHPLLSNFTVKCALTKQGVKFLYTLSVKSGDNAVAGKLIGKFVAGSPKSISLNTLFHLLSPDTAHPNLAHHSLPLYLKIKEATWFEYNPKLAASLAALLEKQGKHGESEELISEAISKLQNRPRDLAAFRFNLLESHAKHGASPGLDRSISAVRDLAVGSSSIHLKRRSFESLISGLCAADRPAEAEALMEEMRSEGLKPSVFEFRSVVYSYGRTGLLEDMVRVVGLMERDGMAIETVCSNMVLSSYGTHGDLSGMLTWLRRMKSSRVAFSVRTCNSVLNRCPGVLAMLGDFDGAPVSIEELGSSLEGDEAAVVGELVPAGAVLEGAMEWGASEAKLDLHGMHLGTAYLILLEWMVEMRRRLRGDGVVPAEVVVVCGSGKHSNVRGVSPVKLMVREMMRRTGSPMRIDRKNSGCFIAKGKNVRDWLCK